jgi:hypothetical protein
VRIVAEPAGSIKNSADETSPTVSCTRWAEAMVDGLLVAAITGIGVICGSLFMLQPKIRPMDGARHKDNINDRFSIRTSFRPTGA